MPAKKSYRILSVLAIVLSSFVSDPSVDYSKEFGTDYRDADLLAVKLRPLLQQYAKDFGENPLLMESIVFPELIRYNRVYDVFETGSLCALYSNLGKDYANFSIGNFQMKPSFAESLEAFLYQKRNEDWVIKLGFDQDFSNDDFTQRMARVRRLQNSEWQLRYLVAFIKCCRLKFSTEWDTNSGEQLKFIATAYNAGWQLPASEIKQWVERKYYHIGRFNPSKRYSYAAIALYRFNQLKVEGIGN